MQPFGARPVTLDDCVFMRELGFEPAPILMRLPEPWRPTLAEIEQLCAASAAHPAIVARTRSGGFRGFLA